MKKILFIMMCSIAYANIAVASSRSETEDPIQQFVHIVLPENDAARQNMSICRLMESRDPESPQLVYKLAIEHPALLQGIIHEGKTFAMLCINRGYADVLARLLNEDYPVDLATPCELYGPENPQTSVLYQLLIQVDNLYRFKKYFPEDYIESVVALTKLMIKKNPDLADQPLKLSKTPRERAISFTTEAYNLLR